MLLVGFMFGVRLAVLSCVLYGCGALARELWAWSSTCYIRFFVVVMGTWVMSCLQGMVSRAWCWDLYIAWLFWCSVLSFAWELKLHY
jgi:hypothetical protein